LLNLPFYQSVLREFEITAAKILFSKNIPFCIYRFPGEKIFHLAIDSIFVESKERKTLWFAPFDASADNVDIFMSVIDEIELTTTFINNLQNISQQNKINTTLSRETSREDYDNSFRKYLQEIEKGDLKKAILSRVIYQEKPLDFHPVDFFVKLAIDYSDAFVHLSQHPASGMWIGATPELLIQQSSDQLHVMALAGTQARHSKQQPYHWRPKEEEEHRMVNEHIENVLRKFNCRILKKEGPITTEAAYVAHLKTDYTVEANKSDLKAFLKELHPTPAVGGLPIKKGMECIRNFEGYNRSYYCGFIGETDFNTEVNLFINLRCMQVGEDKLAIYVGGGITAASDPEEEWQETILKSKTMMDKIQTQTTLLKDGIVG